MLTLAKLQIDCSSNRGVLGWLEIMTDFTFESRYLYLSGAVPTYGI